MNDASGLKITGRWIVSCRGKKNNVDPRKPYYWLVEKELTSDGKVEDAGVIFLTNRECPFHCLMCDLWKNTTDETVATGAIPGQIEWALEKMPGIKHIKLYNSGSFFDQKAIPVEDHKRIAELLKGFKTVIVESHPVFINEKCLRFRDMLKTDLQVALGLEIANDEILSKLNKKMTCDDFRNAVFFLGRNMIRTRAFILLKPPFLSESEGIYQAKKSIDFSLHAGAGYCIIIPVRPGNGAMDILEKKGVFTPPGIKSLEKVLEYGISLRTGRVFADTWDLKLFSKCSKCADTRIRRINEMNLNQKTAAPVICDCE